MTSRIPPLLQPYVQHLPKDSLHVLTNVLGTDTNWLIIRYLCAVYGRVGPVPGDAEIPNIILVSWLRDWNHWKDETRKASGLALDKLGQNGKFICIDGLMTFALSPPADVNGLQGLARSSKASGGDNLLPMLGPNQQPPYVKVLGSHHLIHTIDIIQHAISSFSTNSRSSAGSSGSAITTTTTTTTTSSSSSKTVLILDGLEVLLGTANASAASLLNFIFALRCHPSVHAAVLALSADVFMANSRHGYGGSGNHSDGNSNINNNTPTPIELEHQALLVDLSHQADMVLSTRMLDTGSARDVSGVVRITRGGRPVEADDHLENGELVGEDKEFLYNVYKDGKAKVWERGSGEG